MVCLAVAMQDHDKFIKDQFRILRKRHQLRDVILHTSFFEAIIIDTAELDSKKSWFKEGLKKLGLVIDYTDESISEYSAECAHKDDLLIEINSLRAKRNELLHNIINNRLPQNTVNNIIREMGQDILKIYNRSPLVIEYFVSHYSFDPRELLNS